MALLAKGPAIGKHKGQWEIHSLKLTKIAFFFFFGFAFKCVQHPRVMGTESPRSREFTANYYIGPPSEPICHHLYETPVLTCRASPQLGLSTLDLPS